jgi:hypothetical protein
VVDESVPRPGAENAALLNYPSEASKVNQISGLVGHLDWLLARATSSISQNPIAFYNCAIRIRLDTLDNASWSHPDGERIRRKLLGLTDALANAALRAHLSLRGGKQVPPRLATTLAARANAVVVFARKLGFPSDAREQPSASRPPDINDVVSVLTRLSSAPDILPDLPAAYIQDTADGLLDILAGAAHERAPGAQPAVGRTMRNTGAATIELAQQKHSSAAIPKALRQHDRLAAKVIRRPS